MSKKHGKQNEAVEASAVATLEIDAPASIDEVGHSPTDPDPAVAPFTNDTTGAGQTAIGMDALGDRSSGEPVLGTTDTTGEGQQAIGVDALPSSSEPPPLVDVKISDLVFIESRSDIPTLLRRMGARQICEVGVCEGSHFRSLITAESVTHAVAVDLWTETGIRAHNDCYTPQSELDRMHNTMLELAKVDARVQVIKNYSPLAAKEFPDGYFDFVYIDGDHTYPGVWIDLCEWFPKVRSGGVLAGHDFFEYTFGEVKFGIVEAVTKFIREKGLHLHVDKEGPPELPAHDWFIPKP